MSWADELSRIRYFLRDPRGNIWSDDFLRHLYNDVQQDYQNKTHVLEDLQAQRVPGLYQCAYLFDWEYAFLPSGQSQFYQALSQHDDGVCCHRWEPQQVARTDVDVGDYGIHFTQPWEAFAGEVPGELVRMRFPKNMGTLKFIAYDRKPLLSQNRKQISATDPSFVSRSGLPYAYYMYDAVDNSYVLYPLPSTSFVNEIDGNDGIAFYASGDTEDVTTGTIGVRTGSTDSTEIGASLDIVDTDDSVFMVYDVSPTDMLTAFDEPDFQPFLRKYIRAGVIARAYGGNNDGRIKSLADYWGMRYNLGIEHAKRYRRNRRNDRDYRMMTRGVLTRRAVKHPRLPDPYPAVNP